MIRNEGTADRISRLLVAAAVLFLGWRVRFRLGRRDPGPVLAAAMPLTAAVGFGST